jgi:hypothetical protein
MSYKNPIRIRTRTGIHQNQESVFSLSGFRLWLYKIKGSEGHLSVRLASHLNTTSKDKEPLLPAGSALRHAIRLGEAVASDLGILGHLQ